MKRLVLAAVVSASALVPAWPAQAEPSVLVGSSCTFQAVVTDPTRNDGTTMAVIEGGPVAVSDVSDPAAGPVSVTLVCTVQVGYAGWAHAGPDAAAASASGTSTAAVPPTPVSYVAPEGEPTFMCTEIVVTDIHGNTSHRYLDGEESSSLGDEDSRWSTDPNVPCTGAVCACWDPWFELLADVLDLIDPVEMAVDAIVCPVLVSLWQWQITGVPGVIEIGWDGDVYVFGNFVWDCPPYNS